MHMPWPAHRTGRPTRHQLTRCSRNGAPQQRVGKTCRIEESIIGDIIVVPQQAHRIENSGNRRTWTSQTTIVAGIDRADQMHFDMPPDRDRRWQGDFREDIRYRQQSEVLPDQTERTERKTILLKGAVFPVMVETPTLRGVLSPDIEDDVGVGHFPRVTAAYEMEKATVIGQSERGECEDLPDIEGPVMGHDSQGIPVFWQRVHQSGSHVAAGGDANPVLGNQPHQQRFGISRQRYPRRHQVSRGAC